MHARLCVYLKRYCVLVHRPRCRSHRVGDQHWLAQSVVHVISITVDTAYFCFHSSILVIVPVKLALLSLVSLLAQVPLNCVTATRMLLNGYHMCVSLHAALATEAPTPDLLLLKPHGRGERIINRNMWKHILTQGCYQLFWLFLIIYGANKYMDTTCPMIVPRTATWI